MSEGTGMYEFELPSLKTDEYAAAKQHPDMLLALGDVSHHQKIRN